MVSSANRSNPGCGSCSPEHTPRVHALLDLQQACGDDPRERHRQALLELAALAQEQGTQPFDPSPEDLIRQDRER